VETGQSSMTGARVARIARYVDTDRFLLTYGDGLANINIEELYNFHCAHKKMVTLSGVNMISRFGNLEIDGNKIVSFAEKKRLDDEWINGGFFVCEKEFSQISFNPRRMCS